MLGISPTRLLKAPKMGSSPYILFKISEIPEANVGVKLSPWPTTVLDPPRILLVPSPMLVIPVLIPLPT